jgi:predicted nuclease with TOPRIM domain
MKDPVLQIELLSKECQEKLLGLLQQQSTDLSGLRHDLQALKIELDTFQSERKTLRTIVSQLKQENDLFKEFIRALRDSTDELCHVVDRQTTTSLNHLDKIEVPESTQSTIELRRSLEIIQQSCAQLQNFAQTNNPQ